MHPKKLIIIPILVVLSLSIFIFSGCDSVSTFVPGQSSPSPRAIVYAKLQFQVTIPSKTSSGQFVFIDILDDVTGLAINPNRYAMTPKDPAHFSLEIPVQVGSLVKYRYGRDSSPPTFEYSASGSQVRYRFLQVSGPMTIQDTISAWDDIPYEGLFGRVTGKVFDRNTNSPLPNALVSIAGVQAYSSSDGSFLFEKIPAGVHYLAVAPLDGEFTPYQQEAVVQNGLTTQTYAGVNRRDTVKVTFIARLPDGVTNGVPVRMIGNSLLLGNTFAELGGGLSTIAARAPTMRLRQDKRYELTLDLPAGMDLRYKYSLGDGFWNGELLTDGTFRTRQIIVPTTAIVIDDTIEELQSSDAAPITFSVTANQLPEGESVSIQFNPYGWTEPLPMWYLGNNEWYYVLYNPFSLVEDVQYRYCRNGQCESAPEDRNVKGRQFSISEKPQALKDEINSWSWLAKSSQQTVVIAPQIKPRNNFASGIELSTNYQPSWLPYMQNAFTSIRALEAQWLIFTPTWTFTSNNPPALELLPANNGFWQDHLRSLQLAKDNGLLPLVFPMVNFEKGYSEWWNNAQKDNGWWQSWFDRYSTFIINNADLAEQVKAKAIILGDPGVAGAVPKQNTTGQNSTLSQDAQGRWKKLITDIRSHYKGEIYWALEYSPAVSPAVPNFFEPDGFYILAGGSLKNETQTDLVKFISLAFDKVLKPIKDVTKKPMIIGIDYPSIQSARNGCVFIKNVCSPFYWLDQPGQAETIQAVDLQEQAEIYNSFLSVINDRNWIDGFISRRYYPPVTLQDKSSSIHGKPAADVVWYWFSKLNQ